MEYRTIAKASSDEFVEKKSRFIGYIKPVATQDEAVVFINEIKSKHWDATHNVYAYVLRDGQIRRYSDDGEPQGTAGMPTLDTVRKSGVDDAVVVVTRYFGGTLLGAGGLVRAYAKAAKIALEAACIVTYSVYAAYRVVCSYGDYQRLLKEFPRFGVLTDGTDFTDCVRIDCAVPLTDEPSFLTGIRDLTGARAVCERTGERFDCPREQ